MLDACGKDERYDESAVGHVLCAAILGTDAGLVEDGARGQLGLKYVETLGEVAYMSRMRRLIKWVRSRF